jgi:peroxiredoxin
MKTAAFALVLLTVTSAAPRGSVAQAPAGPYQIGAVVPTDVTLTDIYGKAHTLGQYRGKIVFIHFWSIVCPYERLAEPKCVEMQKQFGDKVVEIAINANQRELQPDSNPPHANLRDHAEKAALNFIVAVDPGNKLTDLFGATNTPHCFVIDRDGTLRYAGALDDDPRGQKKEQATPYVKNAIESLLAGNPVAVSTTRPYG